jgi:hypothetical protein
VEALHERPLRGLLSARLRSRDLVNKPSRATIDALRSALGDIEHLRRQSAQADGFRATLDHAQDKVSRALAQLEQNDDLPCDWPGCHVRKPTRRALSSHYAMTHGPRRS